MGARLRCSALLGLGALVLSSCQSAASNPDFYFGVDLSYVNEMEDCGAVYMEDGVAKDPYVLFAEHGSNLVRARLWHNPDWTNYSTLEDVKETFTRAREAGMDTLLDFHYSDNWADPGRQEIPAAWADIEDEDELAEALYQYTYGTLIELNAEGLMPDFVQVGNETNSGMLKERVRLDWPRDAKLFQAGIRAVREAGEETGTNPRIILHVAQPENTGWWFSEAAENGITDFDVIGISYYPQWSSYSISGMAAQANYLRRTYGKEVMVVEAGYPWTVEEADNAGNVLTQGQPSYPVTPAGQRLFMTDLTQALISNGASGIVYWEPAWVSTDCFTRWGQGSHWDNAAFFDSANNNELLEVIDYQTAAYSYPESVADGQVDEEYGAPLIMDATGDALNDSAELDLVSLYAMVVGDEIRLALTTTGDPLEAPGNSYRVYFDTTEDDEGATFDLGKRPIVVDDPYRPEYAIEISIAGERGAAMAEAAFFAWDGLAWVESAFTGSIASSSDEAFAIELHFPLALLGDPAFVNLAALSAGRVQSRTAADLLGSDATPADATAEAHLSDFVRLDLVE